MGGRGIYHVHGTLAISSTHKIHYFIFYGRKKDIKKANDWFCLLNQIKYFLVRALITAGCKGHGLNFLLQKVASGMSPRLRLLLFSLGGFCLHWQGPETSRGSLDCLLDFYLLIRVLLLKSCQHFTLLRGFLVFYCLWAAWGVGTGGSSANKYNIYIIVGMGRMPRSYYPHTQGLLSLAHEPQGKLMAGIAHAYLSTAWHGFSVDDLLFTHSEWLFKPRYSYLSGFQSSMG